MSINEVFSEYEKQMDLLEEYLLSLCVKVKLLIKYVFHSSKVLGLLDQLDVLQKGREHDIGKAGLFLDLNKKAR